MKQWSDVSFTETVEAVCKKLQDDPTASLPNNTALHQQDLLLALSSISIFHIQGPAMCEERFDPGAVVQVCG